MTMTDVSTTRVEVIIRVVMITSAQVVKTSVNVTDISPFLDSLTGRITLHYQYLRYNFYLLCLQNMVNILLSENSYKYTSVELIL